MSKVEPVVTSMWAFMASWFTPTPTVLFCVLNLMIGTIFIRSNFISQNKKQQQQQQQQQLGEDNSHQLVRAPSLLERVKSINFSLYRSEIHHADPPDHQIIDQAQHVRRSNSDTTGQTPARVPAKMKKSVSEKSVVASTTTTTEEEEEVDRRRSQTARGRKGKWTETALYGADEWVDERADDFIGRFKQQLNLQRLDSLVRVKEMLNRGSGE